jgi:hypothetical protein
MIEFGPEEGEETYDDKPFLGILDQDMLTNVLYDQIPDFITAEYAQNFIDRVVADMEDSGFIFTTYYTPSVAKKMQEVLGEGLDNAS